MNAYAHGTLNVAKDRLRSAILDLEIATRGQHRTPMEGPRVDLVEKAKIDVVDALRAINNALELEGMTEAHEHG